MAIRKFGTEPAKTEMREEDNDRETLSSVASLPLEILDAIDRAAADAPFGEQRERPRRH